MVDLDINISSNKDYVDLLKKKIDLCKENYDSMVINLRKVDSAWNDANTPVFLKHVNHDYTDFMELIDSIKKNINNETNFLNSICNVCKTRFGFSQVSKIKLNSNGVGKSTNDINNIIKKLNNTISSFSNIIVPANFSNKNSIDQISFNLTAINNNLINLQNNLNGLINDIINSKNNTILEYNRISLKTINNKKCEYNWQVVRSDNLKKIDTNFKENVYTVNNNSKIQSFENISSKIKTENREHRNKNDHNNVVSTVIGDNLNNDKKMLNIGNDITLNNVYKSDNLNTGLFGYNSKINFNNESGENYINHNTTNMIDNNNMDFKILNNNNSIKSNKIMSEVNNTNFNIDLASYDGIRFNSDNNIINNNSEINLSELKDINVKTYDSNENFKTIDMFNVNSEIKTNNSNLQNVTSNINIENISQ